jgi:hypothetical protein
MRFLLEGGRGLAERGKIFHAGDSELRRGAEFGQERRTAPWQPRLKLRRFALSL